MTRLPFAIRRVWRGAPVIVVSGLPRSGTSMVMSMLEAGGVELVTDAVRGADDDNPRGYFELERVKALVDDDGAWLRDARGKAVKVISHLLKFLPLDNDYAVVFVERALPEVVASQNRMLERRGEPNPMDDEATLAAYSKHLLAVRAQLAARPNCRVTWLRYGDVVAEPGAAAARLREFLGNGLDAGRMAAAVDAALYRNRAGADGLLHEAGPA